MHGNTNMAWSSSLCRLRAGTEFIGTGSQKEQVWPEELWQSNQLFPAAEQEEDLFIVNALALWYWSDGTLDIYTKDGSGYHMPRLITKNRSDLWFWFLIPIHRVNPNSKAKTTHRKFSSPSWVFFVVLSLWATLSTWLLVLALGPCKWQKSAVLTGLRCTAQHNTAFSGPTPCFYFHSPESSEFLVSKLTHLLWLSLPIWSLNTADRYLVCFHDPKGACLTDSV